MIDRPDAETLLRAMATTLTDDVLPTTSGPAQHAVRVVANLCRILEREVGLGPARVEATRTELALLLERDGSLPELVEALDRLLAEAPLDAADELDERARRLVLADVERRLEIDRPGYAS
jgi:hypothetical protein